MFLDEFSVGPLQRTVDICHLAPYRAETEILRNSKVNTVEADAWPQLLPADHATY